MIDKRVYELDYIRGLQQKYASDPGLIERALYAFGLLEAIKSVGMPFSEKKAWFLISRSLFCNSVSGYAAISIALL